MVGLRLLYPQPLHQPAVLLRRKLPNLAFAPRPLVHAAFQALIQQDEAVLLPIQGLDPIPPPPAKQKQRIGERIQVKLLLHHGGQAVDPLTQIRITAGNVDAVCAGEVM